MLFTNNHTNNCTPSFSGDSWSISFPPTQLKFCLDSTHTDRHGKEDGAGSRTHIQEAGENDQMCVHTTVYGLTIWQGFISLIMQYNATRNILEVSNTLKYCIRVTT